MIRAALAGELGALLKHGGSGKRALRGGVDRRQRVGSAGDAANEQFLKLTGAREQHLALVGEVAEERSLGQSRALGDLRDGGFLEALLGVELDRRLREPAAAVWFPTDHALNRS